MPHNINIISLHLQREEKDKAAHSIRFDPSDLIYFKSPGTWTSPLCHGETSSPRQLSWLGSFFSFKTFKPQTLFKTAKRKHKDACISLTVFI